MRTRRVPAARAAMTEETIEGRRRMPGRHYDTFEIVHRTEDPRASVRINIETVIRDDVHTQGVRFWAQLDDVRLSSPDVDAIKARLRELHERADDRPWGSYIQIELNSERRGDTRAAMLKVEFEYFQATGKPGDPNAVYRSCDAKGNADRIRSGWPYQLDPNKTGYDDTTVGYVEDTPEHRAALSLLVAQVGEMSIRIRHLFRRSKIRETLAGLASGTPLLPSGKG